MVRGDLARLTPCRPRSAMSRTGGAPGQVTSTVTLGDLPGAPHGVHRFLPQELNIWLLWTLDISALRISSRTLLASGSWLRWV